MKIALLCSGLGHIRRGHEVFATDLFNLVKDSVDMHLFKGGGEAGPGETVLANVSRNDLLLRNIHVLASPRWSEAVREQERLRLETSTFAYAALQPLLAGGYDVIHCLEREVCEIIFDHRHLFARTPKLAFSNGGAMPARELPRCDFVQEHTEHNFRYSDHSKGFVIPHGVDIERFKPQARDDFRSRHGIPHDAFVVITVGTICYHHKRTDHVIREVATLPDVYLLVVGQEHSDSDAIRQLGAELLGTRAIFTQLPHDQLAPAYAAADVFTLGSTFETFGIVYIEAMAMGLPVVCTDHPNQRSIVKEGVFIDMRRPGALATALRQVRAGQFAALGPRGREIAVQTYDLRHLKQQYLDRYRDMAASPCTLPQWSSWQRVKANVRHAHRRMQDIVIGRPD